MRILKRLLVLLLALCIIAAAGLAYLLHRHPSLQPYDALRWQGGPAVSPELKVVFLGVSTVLLDDGETAILTDGFFSRPGKLQTFLGQVAPEDDAIARGLQRSGITEMKSRLAAVIPVHSHYDHAMDAPEVARRTNALLVGSESTANVGRGWGLPESQIRIANMREPMRFGRFTVTLFPSQHAPTGFTGGRIEAPLKPPIRAADYKEGQSYAVLVQHEKKSLLINGSAGFEPGALKDVRAAVVMLGIGSLGTRSDDYREAYWRETVATVQAKRVIPIHWEDFWLSSDEPMKPMPPPLDKFDVSMRFLHERGMKEGVDIRLPQQWQTMDVWRELHTP
ncbi:MBL fold metallo-hydrolase [Noviherbaspirillum cavernae]|nr:MBL fold metallo-hydrolase [Noviherbaspirillum cavernae]